MSSALRPLVVATALTASLATAALSLAGRAQEDTPAPAPAPAETPAPAPETPPATTAPSTPAPAAAPAKKGETKKSEPKKGDEKKAEDKKADEKKPEPAPPAVSAELLSKAKHVKDEVTALLAAEPGDARQLESISMNTPDATASADPALRCLLKMARGRALTIQGRFDEAASQLSDAKGLVDASTSREQKRLTAEVRYRIAVLDEERSKPTPSCGALGLQRVAALEGAEARDRVQLLSARYKSAVQAGDRFWGRRAAFRTAMLYEDLYRFAIGKPAGFRGAALPAPFAVAHVDTKEVVAQVLGGSWPSEISRLYSEVIASIDARDPDDVLLEHARKRAAAFARLTLPEGEKATNPWLADEKPGLVRFNKRFEKKQPDGTWAQLDPKVAREALADNLRKGPGSVEHAYALVALAEAGPAPSTEQILAAIKSGEERVQLAGLLAAEKAPDPALLDAVVELAAKPTKGEAFATLQGSLFGLRERALLALRALGGKDREVAQKILDDTRLNARERVWTIAEIGDGRLEYSLQVYAGNGEPNVAATALYALYLSAGKNSLGYLRTNDNGVVGCVSRAIQSIDSPH